MRCQILLKPWWFSLIFLKPCLEPICLNCHSSICRLSLPWIFTAIIWYSYLNPLCKATKNGNRIGPRMVQNGDIVLNKVFVPEEDRLPCIHSMGVCHVSHYGGMTANRHINGSLKVIRCTSLRGGGGELGNSKTLTYDSK